MPDEIKDQELENVAGGKISREKAPHKLAAPSDAAYQTNEGLEKARIVNIGTAYIGNRYCGKACYKIEVENQGINAWYFEPSGYIFSEQNKVDTSVYDAIEIN